MNLDVRGSFALPDPLIIRANWLALSVFGRERYRGRTDFALNGIPLSAKTLALLYADIGWLMTLFNLDE